MKINASERKPGMQTGPVKIGYWKGPLTHVNPNAAQLQKIYNMEEPPEEPVYQGTNKEGKDWSKIQFIFEDEATKAPIKYDIFMSKEMAAFKGADGVEKTWYINQWGECQLVADEKDLFRSFTHHQKWDKDAGKMVDAVDNEGNVPELQWRAAYGGETSLYSLLRNVVTQNWYEATTEVNLFIKIDHLMRGAVKDIVSFIGTEYFQPVVGMLEVKPEEGENGMVYYSNCVNGAWMPGWKKGDADAATHIKDGWKKYEEKANGKGKNRYIYQFYQAVKRNKNITELSPIHEFDPSKHLNAGNETMKVDTGEVDMNYDV